MTHTPETRVEPPAPAANEKAQRSLTKTIFRNSMVVTLGGGIVRLLDACFHVIGAVMPAEQRDDPDAPIYVPVGMSGVQVFQPAPAAVWCHIQLSPESVPGAPALMCSVQLLNEAGEGVAVIERLDLMQAPRTQWGNDNKTNGWFHQIAWRAQPRTADAATIEPGAWLIIADEAETGAALAETLRARGNTCMLAIPGSNTAQHEPNLWQFDANDPHAIRTLRDAMGPEPIRGVVGMWTSTAEPDSLEALWANQRLATSTVLQLAQPLAERLVAQGLELWNMYGPTETTIWSTVHRVVSAAGQAPAHRNHRSLFCGSNGSCPGCESNRAARIPPGPEHADRDCPNRPEATASAAWAAGHGDR